MPICLQQTSVRPRDMSYPIVIAQDQSKQRVRVVGIPPNLGGAWPEGSHQVWIPGKVGLAIHFRIAAMRLASEVQQCINVCFSTFPPGC